MKEANRIVTLIPTATEEEAHTIAEIVGQIVGAPHASRPAGRGGKPLL